MICDYYQASTVSDPPDDSLVIPGNTPPNSPTNSIVELTAGLTVSTSAYNIMEDLSDKISPGAIPGEDGAPVEPVGIAHLFNTQ